MNRAVRWPALVLGALPPLVLVTAWQASVATGAVDATVWSSPGAVLRTLAAAIRDGSLWQDLSASLRRDLAGLAVGVPAGLATGTLLGLSRLGERLLGPGLTAVRQVALFSWVPLISLWLGNDEPAKVAFIAYATFFPMLLATQGGLRQADPRLAEVARVLCLTRAQTLRRVKLPAAMPAILAGLHLALVYGWLATIGAEYLFSASPGIGSALMTGRAQFRMDQVIASMLAIAAVGLVLNALAASAEAAGRAR